MIMCVLCPFATLTGIHTLAKKVGGNFKKWERVSSCMSSKSSWGVALCLQPVLSVLVGAVGILQS